MIQMLQHQLSDLEPDLPNVDSTWDTNNDVDAKWGTVAQ